MWDKSQIEIENFILFFVWNGKDANTKEKAHSMELPKTYVSWDATKYKTYWKHCNFFIDVKHRGSLENSKIKIT